MDIKAIHSGRLRGIGYDARARVLQVQLDDGSVLQYSGVGAEVWQRLSASGSAWSYYRDNIEEEYTARRGIREECARRSVRQALKEHCRKPHECSLSGMHAGEPRPAL